MRKESWQAICDAHDGGKGVLKSIGVSTYGVRHMQEIIDANLPLPVINQIDLHPFMTRTDVVDLCKKHGIALEAWAPLVRSMRFEHPLIVELAKKYQKTPAQILLRYSLEKGYIPLPKSASKERIISNTQVFDFNFVPSDLERLDGLNENLLTDWDPSNCE